MAQIRLDDEVYDRLKVAAEKDCRTIGEEIHYLLDHNGENPAKRDDDADLYQFLADNFTRLEDKIVSIGCIPEKKMGDFASEKNIKDENPAGEDKSEEIQRLLIERSRVLKDLEEKNLVAWVQKRAVDEFWSDEQAKFEGDLHRKELERERDLITERLKALGM